MSSLSKIFVAESSSLDESFGEENVVNYTDNHLEESIENHKPGSNWAHSEDDDDEVKSHTIQRSPSFQINPLTINRKSFSDPQRTNTNNTLHEDRRNTNFINASEFPRDSENFEIGDVYDDAEYGKSKPSTYPTTSNDSKASERSAMVKKGLVTITDLNDKFMSSNFYYVVVAIILYVGVGIAAYHDMMGWDRFECLYFIVITITTVGYGDYRVNTTGKRVFTAFYILVGVAIFGSLFSTITTFVQDHQERMAKLRSMRAMIRMKEKEAELSRTKSTNFSSASNNSSSHGVPITSWHHGTTISELISGSLTRSNTNTGADHQNEEFADGNMQPRRSRLTHEISRRLSLLSFSEKKREKTLGELREASISTYEEDRQQLKKAAFTDFCVMFSLIIFGMLVMSGIEGWSTGDSFYWATVTILTVGYGDYVPKTVDGKVFTMFYCVFGCAYMAKAVTDFVKFPLLSRLLKHEIKVAKQFSGDLSPEMLEALFNNELYQLVPDLKRNEDEMSKCEFVLLMLQVMNKVEEKDIFLAAKLFDNFDKLKNGKQRLLLIYF